MSLDISLYQMKYIEIFSSNITYNLAEMAEKAGIYEACWRPKSNGYKKAKDILPILEKGYADLKARPEYYRQFNASNGWGTYDDLIIWVEKLIWACKKYPEADIKVS